MAADGTTAQLFRHVVGVQEHAGVRMSGLGGHVQGLAAVAEVGRGTPDFKPGDDAHFAPEFKHRGAALGGVVQRL